MASRSSQSEVMPIFCQGNTLFLGVFLDIISFPGQTVNFRLNHVIHILKAIIPAVNLAYLYTLYVHPVICLIYSCPRYCDRFVQDPSTEIQICRNIRGLFLILCVLLYPCNQRLVTLTKRRCPPRFNVVRTSQEAFVQCPHIGLI